MEMTQWVLDAGCWVTEDSQIWGVRCRVTDVGSGKWDVGGWMLDVQVVDKVTVSSLSGQWEEMKSKSWELRFDWKILKTGRFMLRPHSVQVSGVG
ncbi:hypothetical protein [Algoriphagus sp. NG3]|uniref:hypothetical protein n=1 Tax=Algoriphagus sp. NG3 TaxID=3097546 RepID=UPI002A835E8D|nr:hypothetical protein [Algoriphagus sp. NG3]WPR77420.1 hypothetical protein SLW71_08675 [Algoriphagus sp. NG3]